MLQGVIDSARSLAGAGYGSISTTDEAGWYGDLVTSGVMPEQHERLKETPDGSMFPQYRLGLSGPLGIPAMACHFRSLGLPEFQDLVPAKSFLATSLRNLGLAWASSAWPKEKAARDSPPGTPSVGRGVIALRKQCSCLGLQRLADGVRSVPPVTRPAVRRPVVRTAISAFTGPSRFASLCPGLPGCRDVPTPQPR